MLLYYISDRKQFPGSEENRRALLLQKISEAAHAGVDYIQLREKDLTGRELEGLAREAMQSFRKSKTQTRLLINSRTDIAVTVQADGVHLRSSDISPAEVHGVWRQAAGEGQPIVAVSCHTESEVIAAETFGADFVVFGPVFEKAGKAGTGLNNLRQAITHRISVFALGGVTLENACACVEAGAVGIAGIRLFQGGDVAKTIAQLRNIAR